MRERRQALVFGAAWIASVLAVWTAVTAVVPPPAVDNGAVEARLLVDGPTWTISYEARTLNTTAFGILREASVVQRFELSWVDYGWPYEDVYVTSIHEARNGEGGLYWQYCINGRYATVGSMHQSIRFGDVVRWVFALPGGDDLCG